MEKLAIIGNPCLLAIIAACLPLLAFLEIIFFGKPGKGSVAAISYSWLSLLFSGVVFLQVWNRPELHEELNWFTISETHFTAGVLLNNLSVLMLLLVSLVSLLVHLYSAAYMKADALLHRYWAYLGLFCFSMLLLVIADNLLLIYCSWELVGFSSYLLIGFWTSRERAAAAAQKAFLMNRLGDLGFLTGILIIYVQFQTLSLTELFGQHELVQKAVLFNHLWISSTNQLPDVWLTAAGLAFFAGAMAKSAQFPFHTWLPDAMEGPTPVSSLIHAATMVAAGVFLVVRIAPLLSHGVLLFIAFTGGFTAFFAATCALVQVDLKKILAWSTISQLGFMMLAVGTGAATPAIVHLIAHAFFKCLLFLGVGAVIYAIEHGGAVPGDPQDIRNMGGLKKLMPFTFVCILVAAFSLAGLPFSSGFLSKDAILVHLFEWAENQHGPAVLLPYVALISSIFTSFYIARMVIIVFYGPAPAALSGNLHATPALMKWPMAVLATCSLYPVFTGSINPFGQSWITGGLEAPAVVDHLLAYDLLIPAFVTAASLAAIGLAAYLYGKREVHKHSLPGAVSRFLLNGWYLDRVYAVVFVSPVLYLSSLVFSFDKRVIDGTVHAVGRTGILLSQIVSWIDLHVIDAAVNFIGTLSKSIGNFTRRFQSGRIQYYLSVSLTALLIFFIIKYFNR